MKKFLLSFVLVLFACTCLLTACGDKGLSDNPAADAETIGNGGFAVVKGDYLYYVNGYIDNYANVLKENTSLNETGEVVFGGIYRTKLVNGKVQKDENGFLTKTEQVVSKVVGFENGGFYILGNYIYYTSPHMNQDGGGTVRTDYTDFYRININGTDNEKLYTSKSVSVDEWNVYKIDGAHYVVLVEKVSSTENETETTKTNVVSINAKKATKKTLASNVSSVVLNDENEVEKDYNEYVYYTFTEDGINKVGKTHIASGSKGSYVLSNGASYSVMDHKNDNLYLTITKDDTKLYRLDLSLDENLTNINPYALTISGYTNYYVIDDVLNNLIVVDDSNYMYYLVNGSTNKVLLTASATFVAISDNCVYYIESSILKRVNISTGEIENLGSTEKTYLNSLAKQIDVDGSKIYMFASYTGEDESTNYYLNVTNIFVNKQDSEFVGLFEKGHTPVEPTAEEKEDGAVWIK